MNNRTRFLPGGGEVRQRGNPVWTWDRGPMTIGGRCGFVLPLPESAGEWTISRPVGGGGPARVFGAEAGLPSDFQG